MPGQGSNRTDRWGLYRSLGNFYLADPRRIASRERDVGLWWRLGLHGPIYRAAWVRDTGELYVARLGPSQDEAGEVQVLGIARDRNELEQTLKGWRAICRQPDSITWLRHRAASLGAPKAPRPLSRSLPDIALTGRRVKQAETPGGGHEARQPVTALRRRVNSKLLMAVGATAGVTAPATALVLELAAG